MVASHRVEVQDKVFSLFWMGFLDRSLVSVAEEVEQKRSKGYVTKGDAVWLSTELQMLWKAGRRSSHRTRRS